MPTITILSAKLLSGGATNEVVFAFSENLSGVPSGVSGFEVSFDGGMTWTHTIIDQATTANPNEYEIDFSDEGFEGEPATHWRTLSATGIPFVGGGSVADASGPVLRSSVQDNIIADVQAVVTAVISNAGYAVGDVELDEFAFKSWPPAEPSTAGDGVQLIVQPGPADDNPNQASGCDSKTVDFSLMLTVAKKGVQTDADNCSVRAKALKDKLESALKQDVDRGGNADNTWKFSAAPWSWGDGTVMGFLIRFQVLYRTNYGDPYTKG